MRWLVVAALSSSLLLGGCSAARMALAASGAEIGNHAGTSVTPEGPVERRVELILVPREPRPDELEARPPAPSAADPVEAELPPPPVVPAPVVPTPPPLAPPAEPIDVEPAPGRLVGPPLGTAPLRFACRIEERPAHERVVHRWVEWDVGEKLFYAGIATFDTLVTAALLYGAWNDPPKDKGDHVGELVMAGVFGADAIALWSFVLFTTPTWHEREHLEEGSWRDAAAACPAGLVVERGGEALPVDARGRLSPVDEAWLVRSLVEEGGALVLRAGPRWQEIPLPDEERCRFAEERGLPAPGFCPLPGRGGPLPRAVLSLE